MSAMPSPWAADKACATPTAETPATGERIKATGGCPIALNWKVCWTSARQILPFPPAILLHMFRRTITGPLRMNRITLIRESGGPCTSVPELERGGVGIFSRAMPGRYGVENKTGPPGGCWFPPRSPALPRPAWTATDNLTGGKEGIQKPAV
jgi:hypothetical protein